ncbi:hypothetical protein GPJ56_011064 [Histomonas meleagridis]|uniref:uncharacterized protein n=1 Tax=Histomonas meleagridis TaxID=135588 RepID=UPI003559E475|nr:hypothetical protein GPJ56_011064 [Histomonas meleagridis]KAH0800841.1 hypothetical protein GO595_006594 [Histomonas meleagridis]
MNENSELYVFLPMVKNVVSHLTHPSICAGGGATMNDILTEVNAHISQLFPGHLPLQVHQIALILSNQVGPNNIFETITRNDGVILYKLRQDNYVQPLTDDSIFFPQNVQSLNQFHDVPIPDNIEELNHEIKQLQKKQEELLEEQAHLATCHHLLQNPALLVEEAKKLEGFVISLREMESMVEQKIENLCGFIDNGLRDIK